MDRVLRTGKDIVAYLDEEVMRIRQENRAVTGIVIGSEARRLLTVTCQELMNQPRKDDIAVNRFRGVLLIEDGVNPGRVEVIHAKNPVMPVDSGPLNLKPFGGR